MRISGAFFSIQNYTGHSTFFQFILLSYLSSKIWEIFLNYGCIKYDRKTMYLIDAEIKTLWPFPSQGYRNTTRRQFTFYHSVPTSFRYSTDWLRKDERLSSPCSHSVALNQGPLDWKTSTLTTSSLLHELKTFKKLRAFKKLNKCLIKWDFDSCLLWELPKKIYVNVFLIYSYQKVKSKSF